MLHYWAEYLLKLIPYILRKEVAKRMMQYSSAYWPFWSQAPFTHFSQKSENKVSEYNLQSLHLTWASEGGLGQKANEVVSSNQQGHKSSQNYGSTVAAHLL